MAGPGTTTKNTEKLPPPPEILDPEKHPQNSPKIPKNYLRNTKKCPFWVLFRHLRGNFFSGFQNSGLEGIFSVFFLQISGRAISDLFGGSRGGSQPLLWQSSSKVVERNCPLAGITTTEGRYRSSSVAHCGGRGHGPTTVFTEIDTKHLLHRSSCNLRFPL